MPLRRLEFHLTYLAEPPAHCTCDTHQMRAAMRRPVPIAFQLADVLLELNAELFD
jgi:hypothetical protein